MLKGQDLTILVFIYIENNQQKLHAYHCEYTDQKGKTEAKVILWKAEPIITLCLYV